MSATATLVYRITVVPPLSLTRLEAAVAAVALSTSDPANFGATLVSDVTTVSGTTLVLRTIVFNISSAAFEDNFPAAKGQQSSMFVNLYTHELGAALAMPVVADEVGIA